MFITTTCIINIAWCGILSAKKYDSSWSDKEKYEFLQALDYSQEGIEKIIFGIFKEETNLEYLKGMICNKLEFTDGFISKVNIKPLLERIDLLYKEQKNLLWNLLFRKVNSNQNIKEKDMILEKLKTEESFSKASAITSFPIKSGYITKEDWKEVFDIEHELVTHSLSVGNTSELINNTLALLSKVKKQEFRPFYSKLESVLSPFKDYNIQEINKNLAEFLSKILELTKFPKDSKLIELFSDFSSLEAQFFPSFQDYRNHFTHSFRVFLLGLQFLITKWEIERSVDQNQLLCWIFISFFHDMGYGIQKIDKLSDIIKNQYKDLGDVQPAQFLFSPSSKILAEKIMDLMYKMVIPERDYEDEYRFLRLNPIMSSWDKQMHGMMSAFLFLRIINDITMEDEGFYEKYSKTWDNDFLKPALAMAIHTYPEDHRQNLDIDQHMPRNYIPKVTEPIFPAFLLVLMDEIEYLNRPTFQSFDEPYEMMFDEDIKIKLSIKFNQDLKHFTNIQIDITYDALKIRLIEVGLKLRDSFGRFRTSNWGITFSLIDPDGKIMKFSLLRKEQEEFMKYLNYIGPIQVDSEEYLFALYKDYVSVCFKQHSNCEQELKEWLPSKMNHQILTYYRNNFHTDKRFKGEK